MLDRKLSDLSQKSKRLYFTRNCAFIVHTNALVKCAVHVLCTLHLKIILQCNSYKLYAAFNCYAFHIVASGDREGNTEEKSNGYVVFI